MFVGDSAYLWTPSRLQYVFSKGAIVIYGLCIIIILDDHVPSLNSILISPSMVLIYQETRKALCTLPTLLFVCICSMVWTCSCGSNLICMSNLHEFVGCCPLFVLLNYGMRCIMHQTWNLMSWSVPSPTSLLLEHLSVPIGEAFSTLRNPWMALGDFFFFGDKFNLRNNGFGRLSCRNLHSLIQNHYPWSSKLFIPLEMLAFESINKRSAGMSKCIGRDTITSNQDQN